VSTFGLTEQPNQPTIWFVCLIVFSFYVNL